MKTRAIFPILIVLLAPGACDRRANETAAEPSAASSPSVIAPEAGPAGGEAELRAYIARNEGTGADGESVPVTLFASSTLPDNPASRPPFTERRIRYSPYNLLDGDPRTAWAEGADGSGLGESVSFSFDFMHLSVEEITIDEIRVLPGYFDERHFKANNRVRRLRLRAGEGASLAVDLADAMSEQVIVPPEPIVLSARQNSLTLAIEDVFRGDTYDDTCLSGISFLQSGKRLRPDLPARIGYEGGRYPLESFTGDKELCVVVKDPAFCFFMRPNGTLSGYKEAGVGTDSAHGTWEYDETKGVFQLSFTYVQVLNYSIENSTTKDYRFEKKPLSALGAGSAELMYRGPFYLYAYSGGFIEGLPDRTDGR
jgi:hypothetical protein